MCQATAGNVGTDNANAIATNESNRCTVEANENNFSLNSSPVEQVRTSAILFNETHEFLSSQRRLEMRHTTLRNNQPHSRNHSLDEYPSAHEAIRLSDDARIIGEFSDFSREESSRQLIAAVPIATDVMTRVDTRPRRVHRPRGQFLAENRGE